MLGCVALVPHPRQLNRNLTPIEFMVSELSGATPWEFVDAFPCEDICQHHLTGQKKDGFFKKNPCFFLNLFFWEISSKTRFSFLDLQIPGF
jgi:hypothetical protein